MLLALTGFGMLAVIMYLLFKSKTIPVLVFVIVPVIAAFIAGFSIPEVVDFIKKGVRSTSDMAVLFIFSITFFGTLSDAGMFDYLVDKLVAKAGSNVIMVVVVTAIVAIFSHLDGASITTVMVTIPAMLPLYRKLNIRPHLLVLILGAGMGVMNLLPWGGPVARAAIVLEMDSSDLWHKMIPIQILGCFTTIGLAIVMALREIKYHGAGIIQEGGAGITDEFKTSEEVEKLRRPNLIWFNIATTIFILGLLVWNVLPTYYVFMLGCVIALPVNYPSAKEQKARFSAHAAGAIDVSAVILGAGVMVGILGNSGMLEAMTIPLLEVIPAFIASRLDILMGVLAFPLGIILGTDSYFYGLMPLAMEVGKNYDIQPLSMAVSMLIGKNLALLNSPLVPATFLSIGLVGIELKDHLKYSFVGLFAVSIIMLVFALMIGMV